MLENQFSKHVIPCPKLIFLNDSKHLQIQSRPAPSPVPGGPGGLARSVGMVCGDRLVVTASVGIGGLVRFGGGFH